MNLFFIINFIISMLTLMAFYILISKSSEIFINKHSKNIPEAFWGDKWIGFFQLMFVVLCPVLNVTCLYSILFHFDELCEGIVDDIEKHFGLK